MHFYQPVLVQVQYSWADGDVAMAKLKPDGDEYSL
jgi:hypothetical protein